MTSRFDSDVNSRRNATPWAVMSLSAFIQEMMFCGRVVFSCAYRPDMASRQWFILEWTGEDGNPHRAEAQQWDLCLWRAAQMELQVRARQKGEEQARDEK